MRSVTAAGPSLQAVGSDFSGTISMRRCGPPLMGSPGPHDEAVLGAARVQRMRSVTAKGPGWQSERSRRTTMPGDAALWTSVDEISWSQGP